MRKNLKVSHHLIKGHKGGNHLHLQDTIIKILVSIAADLDILPENAAHHPEIAQILATEATTAVTRIRDLGI